MAGLPENPKLYHITHINNLDNILKDRMLWSYAKQLKLEKAPEIVGISEIKNRRLNKIEVKCHSGTMVGEYVPFYFCPRSIMLYILHKGNHPDITYRDGQLPILHLQVDLRHIVRWANNENVCWAFSDRNAGSYLASFYKDLNHLSKINWSAIKTNDWQNTSVKEYKQAEFLVYDSVPFKLVEKIGVCNNIVKNKVVRKLGMSKQPSVEVRREWYY